MKDLKFKIIILSLAILLPVRTFAIDMPKDLPTIEALIALHKAIKKDEDKALQRVATSFGEQSVITKGANKFNDVRTTLDTRLNNAHSYLVLAGAISSTTNALYMLVREYKDFTSNTFKHVSGKPFVAWYYTDANAAISREVKHCYNLYASVAASGINLMKANHGRETGFGAVTQNIHRPCPTHHRQCEPLLLLGDGLRLEARLHLGDTELRS